MVEKWSRDFFLQRNNVTDDELKSFERLLLIRPAGYDHQGAFFEMKQDLRLKLILKARRLGFSMNEISALLDVVP